jgi:hypothetical protein
VRERHAAEGRIAEFEACLRGLASDTLPTLRPSWWSALRRFR